MKNCLLLFSIFLLSSPLFAKNDAILQGRVTDSKGQPKANVYVSLEQTGLGIITNEDGSFMFSHLQPGPYQLSVKGNGIVSRRENVRLTPGDTLNVEVKVSDTLKMLDEVSITAYKNRYLAGADNDISKMPLSNLENPQVYNVIPQILLKEQIATSYADIFKNIAGSEIPAYANNGRMDISLRGFKVRSYITDGISAYTMTTIDPANIEKVEVLRGPSATLFGSSLTSYGGLVNIVTKQPYDHLGGNVSYTNSSFGLNRLAVDFNTPLNKKHTLLFRINAAGQSENSWQDAGFAKSIFVAPSLTWQMNSKVSLDLSLDYYDRKATSPFWFVPYKKSSITNAEDLLIDFTKSYLNNDIYYTGNQLNFRSRLKAEMKHNWSSQTIFSTTTNKMDGSMVSLQGTSDSTLTHSISSGPMNYATMEIQQNFLHKLDFGKWENKLLVGLDFYHYSDDNSVTSAEVGTENFVNPQSHTSNNFIPAQVNQALAKGKLKSTSTQQNTYSAYVSDVLSLNKRWFLLASLRLDRFQYGGELDKIKDDESGEYGQTALSPKVGLVYQPIENKLSVFLNYMNGFQNVSGSDFNGNSFHPQLANQVEAGLKLKAFHGRLVSTLSTYQILVHRILRDDPEHDEFKIQDGSELSHGVEFNTIYNPYVGFNIIAGYSFNYCVYQKANDGLTGLRPDGAGPQNTANLWMSYRIQNGLAKGLGIGFGGIYGSNLATVKHLNEFYVPGYKVFDASVFYENKHYQIGFKINNLGNERYWNNRLEPQTPRSYSVNLTLSL